MTEKILENQVCQKCGVEVRTDTLYCYNCGSAVNPSEINGNKNNFPTVRDKLIEEEKSEKLQSEKNLQTSKEPKMKSASNLREKRKPQQTRKVEVVWEEPQSVPNFWFLGVALILTIFAVCIFVAMLYIR